MTVAFDCAAEYAHMSKPELHQEIRKLDREIVSMEKDKTKLSMRVTDLKDIVSWSEKNHVLQANDTTRLHKLIQAHIDGRVFNWRNRTQLKVEGINLFDGAKIFVVKHDWHSAVDANLQISDSELQLPFPICCFEFRVSDKNAIVWVGCIPGDTQWRAMLFIEGLSGDWYTGEEFDRETESGIFCWLQIKSICAMLDAEVATHDVVRAPHALNLKRERSGKPPINEYHVIDLSKRYRTQPVGGETGRHIRLHFRRGHWRHFDTHKTWIKWMLVGDPSLGFVDKRYSL